MNLFDKFGTNSIFNLTENEEIIHEEVAFVPMLPGISNGDV